MSTQTLDPATSMKPSTSPASRDRVVLIHGIASTKYFLLPLAQRLRRDGFDPQLYGYFSLLGSIRDLGAQFARKLHRLAERNPDQTIHVVAHSMGSIVTRCALLDGMPDSLGRIVMIGPPNRGSHVARQLTPRLGWISPTLTELSDTPESFVNALPRSVGSHEVGIVTAEHDYMVPAGSTLLDDHADEITLPSLHTSILWRTKTAEHVASFLRTGRF